MTTYVTPGMRLRCLPLKLVYSLILLFVVSIPSATQSVEVSASAALLQTENATLSQVVSTRAVQDLPLNGRNVLNLVALIPGVVPQGGSMSNLQGQNIFGAGNFQIGGGAANQSST